MAKKKPKLPEHLRGKTPEEITEYIMGGMVRSQPKGETIGDYFAKARRKAAEQARKNDYAWDDAAIEEAGTQARKRAEVGAMIEWEDGEWISPEEFRSRQLAAGYAHMDEVAKRGYRERDVAATPIMGALRTANALANERAVAGAQELVNLGQWRDNATRLTLKARLREARNQREYREAFTELRNWVASFAPRKQPKPKEQLWTPW